MRSSSFCGLAVASLLGGCAGMPPVEVGYYLAKSDATITVTQTAACTEKDVPALKTDIAVDAAFSRDTSEFHAVNLSNLGGGLTKGDGTFQFHADGRLKGVGIKQTGQAGEILKAALKVIVPTGVAAAVRQQAPCTALREVV